MTLFEGLALLLVAPVTSWTMDASLLQVGSMTLTISLIAMLWNFAYNWGFDWLERLLGGHISWRGWRARVLQAVGFEFGLLIVTLPLVAIWMSIDLLEALLLDLGFLVFFLVYGFIFNWLYDRYFPVAAPEPVDLALCSARG